MFLNNICSCRASKPLSQKRSRRSVRRLRSEEHTSELQSHRDLHSFPTRRSSDLSHEGPHFGENCYPPDPVDEARDVIDLLRAPCLQGLGQGGGGGCF